MEEGNSSNKTKSVKVVRAMKSEKTIIDNSEIVKSDNKTFFKINRIPIPVLNKNSLYTSCNSNDSTDGCDPFNLTETNLVIEKMFSVEHEDINILQDKILVITKELTRLDKLKNGDITIFYTSEEFLRAELVQLNDFLTLKKRELKKDMRGFKQRVKTDIIKEYKKYKKTVVFDKLADLWIKENFVFGDDYEISSVECHEFFLKWLRKYKKQHEDNKIYVNVIFPSLSEFVHYIRTSDLIPKTIIIKKNDKDKCRYIIGFTLKQLLEEDEDGNSNFKMKESFSITTINRRFKDMRNEIDDLRKQNTELTQLCSVFYDKLKNININEEKSDEKTEIKPKNKKTSDMPKYKRFKYLESKKKNGKLTSEELNEYIELMEGIIGNN